MNLENLGFRENFRLANLTHPEKNHAPGRVSAVSKNNYLVHNGKTEIFAELSGRFFYQIDSALDLPTVGDWVTVSLHDENNLAIIHEILPRQSLLKRKDPGKKLDYQLIAANIDYAFIMQDVNSNFNLNRLERYLVMVTESSIEPVILLSKSDLIDIHDLDQIKRELQRIDTKYKFLIFSNSSGEGLAQINEILRPAHTYCLLGSSGVGKTTLLNNLIGEQKFDVRDVRFSDGKGRHTTTQRQLILLNNGSLFIDTPGMRELGNIAVDQGIEKTFDDIQLLTGCCQFSDCTHRSEDGCAVLDALENGQIDQKKYDNFIKISKESAFYKMSYLDKRKRDKAFGKMYKQVMKNNRKK